MVFYFLNLSIRPENEIYYLCGLPPISISLHLYVSHLRYAKYQKILFLIFAFHYSRPFHGMESKKNMQRPGLASPARPLQLTQPPAVVTLARPLQRARRPALPRTTSRPTPHGQGRPAVYGLPSDKGGMASRGLLSSDQAARRCSKTRTQPSAVQVVTYANDPATFQSDSVDVIWTGRCRRDSIAHNLVVLVTLYCMYVCLYLCVYGCGCANCNSYIRWLIISILFSHLIEACVSLLSSERKIFNQQI